MSIVDSGITNEKTEQIKDKFYKTPLGEKFKLSFEDSIRRVPGGWVYLHSNVNGATSCFIPMAD